MLLNLMKWCTSLKKNWKPQFINFEKVLKKVPVWSSIRCLVSCLKKLYKYVTCSEVKMFLFQISKKISWHWEDDKCKVCNIFFSSLSKHVGNFPKLIEQLPIELHYHFKIWSVLLYRLKIIINLKFIENVHIIFTIFKKTWKSVLLSIQDFVQQCFF